MKSKERAYQFALKIIRFIEIIPKNISTVIIAKQLLRAATSIGANITEAQASPSRKDFTNFFNHSLKSANETKYWLELLRDSNLGEKQALNQLIQEVDEIAKILASSIITLRSKKTF